MKVVHLSTTDMGGAYEAAQRISDCLGVVGVESEVLVRSKFRESTKTISFYSNFVQKFISKAKNFFNLMLSDGEVVFDKYGADICDHPHIMQADVICLHWVNSFVSVPEVEKILALGKPVYWIMHDMWPFTGGCHYAGDCERYMANCDKCQMVKDSKKSAVTYWQNKKYDCFHGWNLHPVGPSTWISACAQESKIFREKTVETIPNPINTELFFPKAEKEKEAIKKKYGLSDKKHTILFGAAKVTNNPIKGFRYFADAVNKLSKEEYQILVLGQSEGEDVLKQEIDMEVVYTGFINDVSQLCDIYNIADLLVAPSLQENYSNTVLESLTCGTPAVVFNVGGMSDLVQTGYNGYLAKCKDADDLAKGIMCVVQDKELLSKNAREQVMQKNTFTMIGEKYKNLFLQHLLNEDGNE